MTQLPLIQRLPLSPAGADLSIIETMTDTYKMKAAVLGAKEASDLPIIATFSFDKDGRLLTGGNIKGGHYTP